jgi:hypothetical protein
MSNPPTLSLTVKTIPESLISALQGHVCLSKSNIDWIMNVKNIYYIVRTTLKYNIIYDQLPKEIKNDISK